MRARAILGTLLLILLALRANIIYSQTPQGFTYQAVVRNSSGTPIANQNVSLKITLQSNSGTSYFSESKSVTTNAQGVLNHIVGSGTLISGDLYAIPWSSGDVYLKVEIDPAGGTAYSQMGDPAQLLSVPYALYAASGNQGPAGTDGVGVSGVVDNGDGSLTFSFTDGSSYKTPNLKGDKGEKGDTGTGLTNRGNWQTGLIYNPGDYVFATNSGQTGNSMWIVQAAASFTSSTEPRLDPSNWVEFQAPQGEKGDKGDNGTPILWLGTFTGTPTSYSLNNAYYNSTDRKAYVYDGSTWKTLAVDGSNGLPITWKGDLASAPASPSLNWAYYNTGSKKAFIYNGSTWDILAQDGMPISGTSGQTLYYNGSAWTPTSTLFNDNTNVGVGTSSPTQKLDVNGGIRLRSSIYDASNSAGLASQLLVNNGSGAVWQSLSTSGIPSGTGVSGQVAMWNGTNSIQGLSNVTWTSSLQVVSPTTAGTDDPILEVKNKDGKVVFGVYQGGVRIYVEDSQITKGVRGGFAIGGLTNQSKGQQEYFRITPDSARIYVKEVPTAKGVRGGFAIGGLTNQSKTVVKRNLMFVAPDSTRIYINDENTKGVRGGFAIGGLTNQSKGGRNNFFNIETESSKIINPSQPRILWYPLKNAFLTGQVLIEHQDSVGTNSFASGFESRAKGEYSQALGFKAYAIGNYSTAIGKNSVAYNDNSFSFGENTIASGLGSYAFGFGALASGEGSFAFGNNSKAIANGSISMGWDNTSSGLNSISFGHLSVASNNYSIAMGYQASAIGPYSTAYGIYTQAIGSNSSAFGYGSVAKGTSSTAMGAYSTASGNESVCLGYNAIASGNQSSALGWFVTAGGGQSFAVNDGTKTTHWASSAFGHKTRANASISVTMGDKTVSHSKASLVIGKNNYFWGNQDWFDNTDPAFIIGNGAYISDFEPDTLNRSNAFVVLFNGKTGVNMNVPTYMLDVNGEITSRNGDAIRLRNSAYSTLMHHDGSDFYLLVTNLNDPDGS